MHYICYNTFDGEDMRLSRLVVFRRRIKTRVERGEGKMLIEVDVTRPII